VGACCELPPGSRVGTFVICPGLPDGPARAAISASAIYTQKKQELEKTDGDPKTWHSSPNSHQTNKHLSDCADPTWYDQTTLSDSRHWDTLVRGNILNVYLLAQILICSLQLALLK